MLARSARSHTAATLRVVHRSCRLTLKRERLLVQKGLRSGLKGVRFSERMRERVAIASLPLDYDDGGAAIQMGRLAAAQNNNK